MVAAKRVVIAGAEGVFGSLLAHELRGRAGFDVVPLARRQLDLGDLRSVRRAVEGAFAVCCTAGPFQGLDPSAVSVVTDAGAHWLDIADDADWFFALIDDKERGEAARRRGVAIVPGLSTLPAISTALVRLGFATRPYARRAQIVS